MLSEVIVRNADDHAVEATPTDPPLPNRVKAFSPE